MVFRAELVLFALAFGVVCQGCLHGLHSSVPEEWFNTKWTYNESDAAVKIGLLPPSQWKKSFGLCDVDLKNAHQSPIDIQHSDVPEGRAGVLPLEFGNVTCGLSYRNIGSTLSAMPTNPDACKAGFTTYSGTSYKFYEAHIHWHQFHNHKGTEHKVDGQAEAVEVHLVHYNAKFKSMQDAYDDANVGNVAVVAVRYTVAPTQDNASEVVAFNYFIVPTYPDLAYMDPNVSVKGDAINPYDLIGTALPRTDLPMYHYNGSVTTPRCDSIVSWYVVQQTVMMSQAQMHQLRFFTHVNRSEATKPKLGFNNDANVRPVAPMNGRLIVAWPYVVEPNITSDSDESGLASESDDESGLKGWEVGLIVGGSVLGAALVAGLIIFLIIKLGGNKKHYEAVVNA